MFEGVGNVCSDTNISIWWEHEKLAQTQSEQNQKKKNEPKNTEFQQYIETN